MSSQLLGTPCMCKEGSWVSGQPHSAAHQASQASNITLLLSANPPVKHRFIFAEIAATPAKP